MQYRLLKSLAATLLLIAACLPLGGGCSGQDQAVKIYPPSDEGIAECTADHPDQAEQCAAALSGAQSEHQTTVQHYSQADCFAQYGEAACQPHDNGSYFAPAMAGFMFGMAVNGAMPIYHPVYVNLSGQAYYGHTVLGSYRPGVHVYVTPAPNSVWVHQYRSTAVVSIPRNTPVAAPAFKANPGGGPPRIERGNIGGAAAVSTAAPPRAPAPSATTPGAAPRIERGNIGGAAAVTKATPPTFSASPSPSRAPSPSPAGISRGGMGGGGSMGGGSRSSSSGKGR